MGELLSPCRFLPLMTKLCGLRSNENKNCWMKQMFLKSHSFLKSDLYRQLILTSLDKQDAHVHFINSCIYTHYPKYHLIYDVLIQVVFNNTPTGHDWIVKLLLFWMGELSCPCLQWLCFIFTWKMVAIGFHGIIDHRGVFEGFFPELQWSKGQRVLY